MSTPLTYNALQKMPSYRTTIFPIYRHLSGFIDQLPRRFDTEGSLLHKGRNTVKLFEANGTRLVVKKFRKPNIVQRMAYTFFKPPKAARAYMYAVRLRARDIGTPHEVAYIETRKWGLFTTGYFVSLYCADPQVKDKLLPSGTQHFDGDILAYEERDRMTSDMAAFISTMHTNGVLHGDLNISNILYKTDEGGCHTFNVIDTDRAKFKTPSRGECLEDLKRVTHDRALLSLLVKYYAARRGWNAEKTTAEVMEKLDIFEKKDLLKRKLKRMLVRKKP